MRHTSVSALCSCLRNCLTTSGPWRPTCSTTRTARPSTRRGRTGSGCTRTGGLQTWILRRSKSLVILKPVLCDDNSTLIPERPQSKRLNFSGRQTVKSSLRQRITKGGNLWQHKIKRVNPHPNFQQDLPSYNSELPFYQRFRYLKWPTEDKSDKKF